MANDDDKKGPPEFGRRDMLKGALAGAATVGLSAADAASAQAATPVEALDVQPVNPYGGGPSTGLQFPPYYKPTPSVRSRNNYFPGSEALGAWSDRCPGAPLPARRASSETELPP
jgi:ribonuclease Z